MSNDLERAAAFEEAMRDSVAERLVSSSLGTAVFTDSLPRVWSLNTLRIQQRNASAAEIAVEAERLQGEAGLPHRRVLVADENAGRRLEEPFNRLGWNTDAFVFMVARRTPARHVDTSAVVEVERTATAFLHDQIAWETLDGADEETVRQIAAANERVSRAGRARHFAVVVDGEVVSSTDLYSDSRTAQIEDVGTLVEHRGCGHASAVVMGALGEARATGHDLVFLTADARDWPKELYRRLGFDPVGEKYAFLRRTLTEASAAPRPGIGAS
jgi:ribosomal protein S18 acetylase RimI-like enzyme